jgi:hypothetical protein
VTDEAKNQMLDLIRGEVENCQKSIRNAKTVLEYWATLSLLSLETFDPADGGKYVRSKAAEARDLARRIHEFIFGADPPHRPWDK